MSAKGELDELFELKTNFFLGNYQGAINEASSLRVAPGTPSFSLKDVYTYRSYIALGDSSVVLDEVPPAGSAPASTATEVLAVRALALIASGRKDDGLGELATVLQLHEQRVGGPRSDALLLLSGFVFLLSGNFEEALKCAVQTTSLEGRALAIQIYLQINRADLAEKEWLRMKAIEEDAPLSQLAQAWIAILRGGERLREAELIYQEMIESYSPTPLLLNGLANCFIQAGKYEEAEKALHSALQLNNKDPETIINLVVCASQRNKGVHSDAEKRLLRTLHTSSPNHRWVLGTQAKEAIFDAVSSRFLPTDGAATSS